MTLDTGDVDADESIGVNDLTVSVGQTKAAWMADLDAAFESIDGAERIDMAAGRRRELSPLSSWYRRCSAAWFAAWREFQHDVHIPVFRKDDGPVSSDVDDSEWDDRVDGEAASAARFTSFRTWANGPQGAFLSQSLTRAGDGSILSRMEVMHVVNVAATTAHSAAEAAIGRSLVLNDDNTATTGALNTIRNEVNAELHEALLKNRGEGPRASSAVWTPNSDDNFGVAEPTLTAVLELNVNGVVFKVNTVIRVR